MLHNKNILKYVLLSYLKFSFQYCDYNLPLVYHKNKIPLNKISQFVFVLKIQYISQGLEYLYFFIFSLVTIYNKGKGLFSQKPFPLLKWKKKTTRKKLCPAETVTQLFQKIKTKKNVLCFQYCLQNDIISIVLTHALLSYKNLGFKVETELTFSRFHSPKKYFVREIPITSDHKFLFSTAQDLIQKFILCLTITPRTFVILA